MRNNPIPLIYKSLAYLPETISYSLSNFVLRRQDFPDNNIFSYDCFTVKSFRPAQNYLITDTFQTFFQQKSDLDFPTKKQATTPAIPESWLFSLSVIFSDKTSTAYFDISILSLIISVSISAASSIPESSSSLIILS